MIYSLYYLEKIMNPEVENHIRNNTTWAKLPNNVRQVMFILVVFKNNKLFSCFFFSFLKLIGNSQKEYEKAIVNYCIKNQSRFKDTLGKLFSFLWDLMMTLVAFWSYPFKVSNSWNPYKFPTYWYSMIVLILHHFFLIRKVK